MEGRKRVAMELDRISNLPSGVTVKILSCLSIKDAVRTSVLSSNWRYKSAMLPHLVFDRKCVPTEHYTFASIVDHVLLSHIGSIHKFRLAQENLSFRDIDRWILHLSRNSVKEFILEILGQQYYKLPSSMFLCRDLTHLELYRCLLQLPTTFTGFKSLKSLSIVRASLTDDALHNMIVHSPLLQRLAVEDCDDFNQLNINAPNLQVLRFMSNFKDINILNTSYLVDVSIRLCTFSHRQGTCRSSNLLQFLAQVPNIHRLSVDGKFTGYLAVGSLPKKLPKPCLHLKYLTTGVCIQDVEDIIIVLCLLRMSPALEELTVLTQLGKALATPVGNVSSWVDDNQIFSFPRLQHVKLYCISPYDGALELIRVLLLRSPALVTMAIYYPSEGYDLAKKLLRFRRASLNVEIILIDF